jgi:regulator of RNase E activity RraA
MYINASIDNIQFSGEWERPDPDNVAKLGETAVAMIGDSRSRLGMMAANIRSVTPGFAMAGSVLPILVWEGDNLAIHAALDIAKPGDVLVINANGEVNRSVFGDILAEICLKRGVRGVVIDGAVRDVDSIIEFKLPVFARGTCPTGPAKHGPGTVGRPVACGHVVCSAGDVVVGDSDGVIIIPRAELDSTLAAIERQLDVEKTIRGKIRADV